MGFKKAAKQHMQLGESVSIIRDGTKFSGIIEENSFLDQSHLKVDEDSLLVLRNDSKGVRYWVPMGSKMGIVVSKPINTIPKEGEEDSDQGEEESE